ncbi:ABC transporter permease subunit [Streptomyces sp. SID5785]|uniref:ABC transporter permease n=1 Tax=Streptomyces sp. SID5785 TaxID=2690309 RepID=UPI0013617940|nr:ABC transporter permease [Streptomyces sp. SID5785]MZD05663.1 ABC transporter permease subunit [Streptomyces sp. SID5785]
MSDLTKSAEAPAAAAAGGPLPTPEKKPGKEKSRSLWSDAWRDLRSNWVFIVSATLIVLLLVIVAFPGLFSSTDPTARDLSGHYLAKPELGKVFSDGWLGYDAQGQSVYSRMIHGTRASVLVGLGTTVVVTLFGGIIGMLAGYFGGWLDAVLSRLTDMFMGIPFLLGALVLLNAFEDRSIPVVIGALSFLGWTQTARVMRGSVITVKQADYVQAAKALGAGTNRILFKHILPNAIAPVIVVATISLGVYISAEATLSFLGLGLTSGVSWGADISAGGNSIRVAQHIILFPSIMLSIAVLSFIMLGEAVRNALDPKTR